MKPQHKNQILLAVMAAVLTLLIPTLSSADTLTVTGGEWSVHSQLHPQGDFSVAGSNFSGFARAFINESAWPGSWAAGSTVEPLVSGSTFHPHANFVVNGVTYNMGVGGISSHNLQITTAPFDIPVGFQGVGGLTTPATLAGSIQLCTTISNCMEHIVAGQGTATVRFCCARFPPDPDIIQRFQGLGLTVTFEPVSNGVGGQAPIPEPATLLLFGSGLAGLAAKRRMRST